MEAKVDKDACIGCEVCVSICPEVFAMDAEQKAKVITSPIPTEIENKAEEAKNSCPVNAISIA